MQDVNLSAMTVDRFAQELAIILTSSDPVEGLDRLMEVGLMLEFLPEVVELTGPRAEQDPIYHPEGNVKIHTWRVVQGLAGGSFELVFGGLLHDIGKPATFVRSGLRISNHGHAKVGAEIARFICQRLGLSTGQTDHIVQLVLLHMKMHVADTLSRRKLLSLLDHPHIEDLIALQHADALGAGFDGQKWSKRDFLVKQLGEKRQLMTPSPLVTGDTLIRLRLTPGPEFKSILAAAWAAQNSLNPPFTTEVEAVAWLQTTKLVKSA
jgi:hypothetical protein